MYPIDKGLFAELARCDADKISKSAGCSYDPAEGAYSLPAWTDVIKVFPNQQRIECLRGSGPAPHSYFSVFVIHHLLVLDKPDPVHEWISEKDIPGGATFFRGPHAIPTELISSRFENDIESFKQTCSRLRGQMLSMADAAYSFQITPKTVAAVLYWQGDEDFPPEAKLLFDRSLAGYLAPDAVFALAVDICSRLANG